MTRFLIASFLLFLLLCKCGVKENKNTVVFKKFLNEIFDKDIPSERCFYIIVPKNGCQGSIAESLVEINNYLDANSCHVVFISNNELAITNYLSKEREVWFDNSNKLNILNLPISNNTIVSTINNRVDFINSSRDCDITISDKFFTLLEKYNYCI